MGSERWRVEVVLFLRENGGIVPFLLLCVGREYLLSHLIFVLAGAFSSLGASNRSVDSVD